MSEYEPTAADLDDVEMQEFDTSAIDDSDAWVDSILAGLSGKDY